jgi:hypothetical protein
VEHRSTRVVRIGEAPPPRAKAARPSVTGELTAAKPPVGPGRLRFGNPVMIYHMPCAASDALFVASTLAEEGPAEHEITQWAIAHGYQPPHDARTFVFYAHGAQARAWRVIQRGPTAHSTEH